MTTSVAIGQNLISSDIASGMSAINNKMQKTAIQAATGQAIVKPSDNPAGLAIGTGLKIDTQLLQTALDGTIQANAMLGVAAGVASTVQDTLTQMTSLAAEAISGSISNQQRVYLNEQFQQLYSQIDETVTSGQFNGVTLLDGSIAGGGGLTTNTTSASSGATQSVSITFGAGNGAATAVGFLTINGVAFDLAAATNIAGTDIALLNTLTGAQVATTIAEIINNTLSGSSNTSMTEQNYEGLTDLVAVANGSVLTITSKRAGAGGEFVVTAGTTNTAVYVTSIANTTQTVTVTAGTAANIVSSVNSGQTTGSMGDSAVSITGTLGNNSIVGLTQTQASSGWVTITSPSSNLISGVTVNMFGTSLSLVNTLTPGTTNQILVGGTYFETLQNIVNFLNNSTDPNIANYTYEAQLIQSSGAVEIQATSKGYTSLVNDAYFTIGTVTGTMASGAAAGLDVSHITDNPGFIGIIPSANVTASMTGTNSALLTVQVGEYTYQADVLNTDPTANYTIKLRSTATTGLGGFFTLTLAANNGVAITTQANADTFATTIAQALGGLTFYQDRQVSSFNPTGTIIENTVVYMTDDAFTTPNVSSIVVTGAQQSSSQNGGITITLSDGSVYSNNTLGWGAAGGSSTTLTNTINSNKVITILWGDNVSFATATDVTLLQQALNQSFGSGTGGLSFLVGTSSTQSIGITLQSITTNTLFNGTSVDLLSAGDATTASAALSAAINTLLSVTALIGSYETRFDSAGNAINISIENYQAATAVYLTADPTAASSAFDNAKTMFQAIISVLAKTNDLGEYLLQLLR